MSNPLVLDYGRSTAFWKHLLNAFPAIALFILCLIVDGTTRNKNNLPFRLGLTLYAITGFVFTFLIYKTRLRRWRWITAKCILDIIFVAILVTGMIEDAYGHHWSNAPTPLQIANLHVRAIARGLEIYANENQGAVPSDLAVLVKSGFINANDLPSSSKSEIMIYLIDSQKNQSDKKKPICVDRYNDAGKWFQFELLGDLTITGPVPIDPSTPAFIPKIGPTTTY